jgi:TPR repeat protein
LPVLFRAIALLLLVVGLSAQQPEPYKRWWQYEDRAAKLTPEEFARTLEAAKLGEVDSAMTIAAAYGKGIGADKNPGESLIWVQRAAASGAPEAQFALSRFYLSGTKLLAADHVQAIAWLKRAADQGHMIAMHNLGSLYRDGIPKALPQNHQLGELWLTRAAEAGFTHSQYLLGLIYAQGDGLPADPVKAERWLREAAQHGHALAMTSLARIYSEADGPPRDPDFVERMLLLASEMRRPEAQYQLARMYRRGYFGAMDLPRAVEWLEISAAKKYAPSQFMLAELYEKGEGVATNASAAAQLYLEAAGLGYSPAICKTVHVYYRGQGVPQDNAAAYKWSLISARKGASECLEIQKKLENELPERERLRIVQEVDAWTASHRSAMSQPLGKYRFPQGIMVPDPPSEHPPSTAEEREKLVKLVALLETHPFGDEVRERATWISDWIADVPDIFFLSCTQLLERDKAKSDYRNRKFLEQQMTFSGAAYQVQHPEGKDQLAIYHAGLLGAARAYEALLARNPDDPAARWPVMDAVLEHRNQGTLRQYVHQQANKNCR